MNFKVSYKGCSYDFTLSTSQSVLDLRKKIFELTGVQVESQKLVGLVSVGKPFPPGNTPLTSLSLKQPVHKLMLFGMSENELRKTLELEALELKSTEKERQKIEEFERKEDAIQAKERERSAAIEAERLRQLEIYRQSARERTQEILDSYQTNGLWSAQQRQGIARHPYLTPQLHSTTDQQLRQSFDPDATITFVLKGQSIATSLTSIPTNFDIGDKLILPQNSLQQLVDNHIQLPFTFKITPVNNNQQQQMEETIEAATAASSNKQNNEVISPRHAGVLEFSAPDGVCFIPFWMMQKLSISEGEEIKLETVKLPKASTASVKSSSFKQLNGIRPILEYHLRKWQSLTIGDIISLPVGDSICELTIIKLTNTENQEVNAASITDTDLSLELLPPCENDLKTAFIPGQEKQGTISADSYTYHALLLKPMSKGYNLKISVTCLDPIGDPDIYASCQTERPSVSNFSWCSQDGSRIITIKGDDNELNESGCIFISIHAYGNKPTGYKLTAEIIQEEKNHHQQQQQTSQQGHRLSEGEMNNASEKIKCPHCLHEIPQPSFQLHEIRCARSLFRCELCGISISPDMKFKHQDLVHSKYSCSECGSIFEQEQLQLHRKFECQNRPVSCKYCSAEFKRSAIGAHQQSCGARSTTCVHCNLQLKWNELSRHLLNDHGIDKIVPERDTK